MPRGASKYTTPPRSPLKIPSGQNRGEREGIYIYIYLLFIFLPRIQHPARVRLRVLIRGSPLLSNHGVSYRPFQNHYTHEISAKGSAEQSFGRILRFGGGQFGAKLLAKFGAKFSGLFCWDIWSKKTSAKTSAQKSAFAKKGACKRGLRKLGHRTYQLHSNFILETWSNHDCH